MRGFMDSVKRVVISVRGDRDFPLADVKLPEHLVADLPVIVDAMVKLKPDATPDDAVRAIWRLGSKAVRDALAHPMRAAGLLKNLPGPVAPIPPVDLSKVPKSETDASGTTGSASDAGASGSGTALQRQGGEGPNDPPAADSTAGGGPFA